MAGNAVDNVANTAKRFMPSFKTLFTLASTGMMVFGIGNILAAGHAASALTAAAGTKIGALDALKEGAIAMVHPPAGFHPTGIKSALEPLGVTANAGKDF